MAETIGTNKSSSHNRSISLPSIAHPLDINVKEQLNTLRSIEASSSASSTCQSLGGLKLLYDSVDDWLQLSLTQQVLSSKSQRRCTEDVLDGSVRLLDVIGCIRDVLSHIKGSIQELESSFRRKRGDSGLANEIEKYITSSKKMKKAICLSFECLNKMKKQHIQNKDSEEKPALSMMREVEQISISVFESLLRFISRPKERSKGWSLVSKVLSSKRVSCEGIADPNEVEDLDAELLVLKSGKPNNIEIRTILKRVEGLKSSIQEIDEVLECVFRCLVKTRVSLLNVLNH